MMRASRNARRARRMRRGGAAGGRCACHCGGVLAVCRRTACSARIRVIDVVLA